MRTDKLKKIDACEDARVWVRTQKNYKEAWMNCERGDWMLWLAKRLGVDDRKLTHAKYLCANQVRYLMKDERSINALDACLKYVNGEISREELNAAADAAYAAAYAADAVAAVYAADAAYAVAAVYAAYAAYAVAYAADAADAYAVAYAADAADARKESLKRYAEFCREILTDEVLSLYRKLK